MTLSYLSFASKNLSDNQKIKSIQMLSKANGLEGLIAGQSMDSYMKKNSTIKDIRKKIIQYLDERFNGNENYKKIVNSSAFCSEKNNIVSDNYKITNNEKIGIIPPIGGG